jgi:hypothetical protein
VNCPGNTVSLRQIPHSVADLPGEAVVKHVGVRIPELIQRLAVVAVPVGVPVQAPAVAFDLNKASWSNGPNPGPFVADLRRRSQAAVGGSDLPVPSYSAVFQAREAEDRNTCKMDVVGAAGERPRAQVKE